MGRRLSLEDFLSRSVARYGPQEFDYSKVKYGGTNKPVTLTCLRHNQTFSQLAYLHLTGQRRCSRCSGRYSNTEEWVEAAREVWGDYWDYSKTRYVRNTARVIIICPQHGEFTQLPKTHLRKSNGCPECGKTTPVTQEVYERRVREVFGDRWDLSQAKYSGNSTAVVLRCKEHGEFNQVPMSTWAGKVGCPECNRKGVPLEKRIKESQDVWGTDRWDYTEVETMGEQVTLKCPQHGEFTQALYDHMQGRVGCSRCRGVKTSAPEIQMLEFISGLGVGEVRHREVGILEGSLEIDIYIPQLKVGVEFNGLYYHSTKFDPSPHRHTRKLQLAEEKGIRLIQVWEDDWKNRRGIVEEHIRQVLGVSTLPKVPARKAELLEIGTSEARSFLNQYHIQGHVASSVYVGAYYLGELVGVVSFTSQEDDYVLTRYATSVNFQGGHSKMVTFFERSRKYRKLITFADLTFSQGKLYELTGWHRDSTIPPDYSYLVRGERKHKFNYRKRRFKEDPALKYEEGRTEIELAELNGMYRVWDAGKIRYTKEHPNPIL